MALTRDTSFVKDTLRVENDRVFSTVDTQVHIPMHYQDKGLVKLTDIAVCVGTFAIVVGDKYLTIRSPLTYKIPFDSMGELTVDGEKYFVFNILAGKPVIDSLITARNTFITVELLIYVLLRAKVPYYFTKDTFLRLLRGASQYSGISLDKDPGIIEVIAALAQRVSADDSRFSRHYPDEPMRHVSLNDINFGTNSDFSRLLNGYQASGLITSLVNDNETPPTLLEKTLRR